MRFSGIRVPLVYLLAAGMLLPCAGCQRSRRGGVSVLGSTSVQPFAEMLAEDFDGRFTQYHVEVQGGGSTFGLQAAEDGIADIGTCSRELKESEAARFLPPVVIAWDGLAIIVPHSNPIGGLTRQQAQDLFSGKITNWKEVGGADLPVRPITREEGSGTREAFVNLVMGKARISRKALTQESNGAVKELVVHDPCAVGYMSLGLVRGEAKILAIDGVMPSVQAVLQSTYKLRRPFLFVMKRPPNAAAQAYIDFVLSPEGQRALEKEGLVGASGATASAPAAANGSGGRK